MSVGLQGRPVAAPSADAARVAAIRNSLGADDPAVIGSFGDRARAEVLAAASRLTRHASSADVAGGVGVIRRMKDAIAALDPSELEPRGGLDNLFNGRNARLQRFRRSAASVWADLEGALASLDERRSGLSTVSEALNGLHEQARALVLDLDAYVEAGRQRLAEAVLTERPRPAPAAVETEGEERPSGPVAVPDLSVSERLTARLQDLTQARDTVLAQLPSVRSVQNVDHFLTESLTSAHGALAGWRKTWSEMLEPPGGKKGYRAPTAALAEAKVALADALDKALARLDRDIVRRDGITRRMQTQAAASQD